MGQVFLYLCRHNAATAWTLQIQLHMPEASVYRALKRLRVLGLIEPVLRIPKRNSRGGPIPKIWGLKGCTQDEVAACINLHYRCLSPKYRLAEEIAQSMLDQFTEEPMEVSYREILIHIKELRIPFRAPDVADLAAQYLHEKGVKVWR